MFNVLAALGLVEETPETPVNARRAAIDAESATRLAADVRIVRTWATLNAALVKLGTPIARLEGVLKFLPTRYDMRAITAAWSDPNRESVYLSHNRANRALRAVSSVFGDTMLIASAKNGGQAIRMTRETKDKGAGGVIFTESARQVSVDWALANNADEVNAIVANITKLGKNSDKAKANAAIVAYYDSLVADAAKDALADVLTSAQLDAYLADREKPSVKRRPMAEIIGPDATNDETPPDNDENDENDESEGENDEN